MSRFAAVNRYARHLPLVLLTTLVLGALAGCHPNELGRLSATSTGDLSLGPAPPRPFAASLAAACGDGAVSDAGRAGFARLPYLQQVTDHSADVVWTTAAAAPSQVRAVGADGRELVAAGVTDESAPLPSGQRQLVARFDGLAPGQVYCYSVESEGTRWLEPGGFRTAPAPGAGTTVRLVVFGDTGTGGIDQVAVRDQLKNVDFDLALLTGDIAFPDGSVEEYEKHYFGMYADFMRHAPFFPASGNHEYTNGDGIAFRETQVLPENGGVDGRERWYSFDWGDLHVAVLDTEKVGPEQAAWLDQDLTANQRPWTIIVGHRPPYSSGVHGSDGAVRSAFGPVLARHHVPLVVNGHDHSYERTTPQDGVTYIVAGGGGVGTRAVGHSDFTAFSQQVSHFVYVEISGDTLRAWAVDATGKTFDTVEMQRPR